MPRYEQRDKDGNVTGAVTVSEDTLKTDPDAVIKFRSADKDDLPVAPSGYDHISTMDYDPDAMVSNVVVHIYAKKGSYEKEKPSILAGMKVLEPKPEKAEGAK